MANSVGPEKREERGVWSGPTLFAKVYLSVYLG